MKAGAASWNHIANLLVGGTGLVFGWMRYFVKPEDEFALVNHPLEPDFQRWHVIFAPLLVFTVALIWGPHVWTRIRTRFRGRRGTGVTLATMFFPMVASGYLLQTAQSPAWREAWVVTHVATSVIWVLIYCLHLSRPKRSPELF